MRFPRGRAHLIGLVFVWLAHTAAEAEITIPPEAMPPPLPLPEAPQIGPFRIGMTFDEARAAAPGATWVEARSSLTGKVHEIGAADALTFAGQSFHVQLARGYFDNYRITLTGSSLIAKEKDCRTRYTNLVTELERTFGTFDAPSRIRPPTQRLISPGGVQFSRTPEGYGVVTGTPAIYEPLPSTKTVGVASHYELNDNSIRDDGAEWTAEWLPPNADDVRSIESIGYHQPSDPRECTATVRIDYAPPAPRYQHVPFEELVVLRSPTISELHYSLEGVDVPADGINVSMHCDVDRMFGRLSYCRWPQPQAAGDEPKAAGDEPKAAGDEPKAADEVERSAPSWARPVALYRLYRLKFDALPLDPDSPIPLETTATVTIHPSERRAVVPTGARPMSMNDVTWKYVPSSETIQSSYPHGALAAGQEAFVEATCQIQADLSLVCTNTVVDPPEFDTFKDSVVELLPLYESAPLLENGEPAVGAWTLIRYQFKIEE